MAKAGIVAMAWGPEPMLYSNRMIARDASAQAYVLNAPVLTQVGMQMADVVETIQVPGETPDNLATTMWMALEAVKWANANDMDELWLAVTVPHLDRCLRDLRLALLMADLSHLIVVNVCPQIFTHKDDDWFRPESKQWRIHNRFNWTIWNAFCWLLPDSLYLRLTDKRPKELR